MNAAEVVYVRTGSGRIHKAAVVEDRVLVDEQCNLDQAPGREEVLAAIPEDSEPEAFCRRCFPGEGAAL